MAKRIRRVGSVANELVKKSREAMLTAVQIYNNPQIDFKSELFIVTTVIAWTYLLHAYYRKHKIDYRQLSRLPGRRNTQQRRAAQFDFGVLRNAWGLKTLQSKQSSSRTCFSLSVSATRSNIRGHRKSTIR